MLSKSLVYKYVYFFSKKIYSITDIQKFYFLSHAIINQWLQSQLYRIVFKKQFTLTWISYDRAGPFDVNSNFKSGSIGHRQ